MPRSESNAIVGKTTYTELNLTNYPDSIDSRSNNKNMAGFENIKDYNYAEHINALADAVMALQRAIGAKPYIDKDNINRTTVSERILAMENKDYDSRYGGAGWDTSQTLVGHTHTGGPGHPSQVNLVSEVQGLLSKTNIDLSASTGLTGADILVSKTDSRQISEAINDKLSISQGGTINKSLEVKGGFQSRLYREWDASTRDAGTLVTDYTAMTNQISRNVGTTACQFYNKAVYNLLYGKYVLAVRARVNSAVTEEVLHLRWYDFMSGEWNLKKNMYLKGTDFTPNKWQMFYLTFDHEGDAANSYSSFHVWKPVTTANVTVDIDCVYIMPTHPAVYDR